MEVHLLLHALGNKSRNGRIAKSTVTVLQRLKFAAQFPTKQLPVINSTWIETLNEGRITQECPHSINITWTVCLHVGGTTVHIWAPYTGSMCFTSASYSLLTPGRRTYVSLRFVFEILDLYLFVLKWMQPQFIMQFWLQVKSGDSWSMRHMCE